MKCPICGANCKCQKRGPEGLCCSCHRHKVRKLRVYDRSLLSESMRASYDQHVEWQREQRKRERDAEDAEQNLLPLT
jgi:hypothetical protein